MKIFNKVSVTAVALATVFALTGPISAFAATAPALGASDGYSIYGDAGVTNTGASHVWGNVGENSLGSPGLLGSQVDGTISAGAGVDGAAGTAYGALDAQGATGSLDLAGTNTVTPGVYTVGATTLNGTLTLDGAGVYIFRSDSSITTSGAGTMNLINGATACNVFWQIPTSMTIGAGSHVEGTIIAQTGLISLATGATLKGRALAHTQVTLDSNQITEPTCGATPPPTPSDTSVTATTTVTTTTNTDIAQVVASPTATLHVIKTVVNGNGGIAVPSNFSLHVKNAGTDVTGSPAAGAVAPGTSYTLAAGAYVVSEDASNLYTQIFSGACDSTGSVTLSAGDDKTCTIINADKPLIATVVVPTPKLPNTGIPPSRGTVPWDIFLSAGILMVASISLVGALKKRTV